MPSRATDLLRRVSDICLALPEASVEHSGSYATFRVRKKVFAYFLDNHHGHGIVSVCVKTQLGENQAYIGPRGWAGFRLDVAPVRWSEVRDLVRSSYRAVAPKKLVSATSE
jgi:predicted DNA-binding protein (MmcQ/YjbR family)